MIVIYLKISNIIAVLINSLQNLLYLPLFQFPSAQTETRNKIFGINITNISIFLIFNQKLYRLTQKTLISSNRNSGREINNILLPRYKYGKITSANINIAFTFLAR